MGRFVFPHRWCFPRCRQPTAADVEDVRRAFGSLRSEIVTSAGAHGFLRLRRPDTPDGVADSTVSEGIAYGMLMAVMLDEQALFDALWSYARLFLNDNGLMDWYIAPDGESVLGRGAATDADEDIAWSLVMAHRQWLQAKYLSDAKLMIEAIWECEVDHDRFRDMLLPGDDWRGHDVFNPSYFAPHQYRLFGEVTGNREGWQRVIDKGYAIIERSQNRLQGNHENGLVPAWCNHAGEAVEAFPGALTNHQYDSARLPFRLGQDWAYHNEPRARAYLARVCEFFAQQGAENIVDGYLLDGTPWPDPKARPGHLGSAVFVGGVAVAAMHDKRYQGLLDAAYARVASGELLARSRYYNHCWTVLSLLMLTGNLVPFGEH